MNDYSSMGRILILLGVILTFLGGVIYFAGDLLHWVGRLPGDIRIEGDSFKFYFPLTTMIIISLVLNLILRLIRFFLN
ncbi:MAG: DUF2905 domain-containing protein [Halanaerobiaceae bacterium]